MGKAIEMMEIGLAGRMRQGPVRPAAARILGDRRETETPAGIVYFAIIETFDRVERTTSNSADPIERALAGYAQIVQLMSAARSPEFPDPSVTMAQMCVSEPSFITG